MEATEELLKSIKVQEIANGRAAVVPSSFNIQSLIGLSDAPPRKSQDVRILDIETMTDYIKREDSDNGSRAVVYVNEDGVCAFFNHYAGDNGVGWCDDLASMKLNKTVEWCNWVGMDKRSMSQKDFIEFVEENYKDIITPSSSEMLTFASKFNMSKKVDFKSAYRISDGETKITYDETVDARSGEIKMPNEFTICIPVIDGAEAITKYAIKARLKVRLTEEKKLVFTYALVRPDIPERNAIKDISDQLSTDLPENRIVRGYVARSTKRSFGFSTLQN